MKKTLFFILFLCMAAFMILPGFGENGEEIAVGMDRAAVEAYLIEEGIVPTLQDEEKIVWSTDAFSLYVTFDPENQTADWVNLDAQGDGVLTLDFTFPDWSMTFDRLMKDLREQGAAYDLYLDPWGKTVFFDGAFFGTRAYLCADFSLDGSLCRVETEQRDGVSVLPWAARMGSTLGAPDEYYGIHDRTEGIIHKLEDGMYWLSNGSGYSLDNKVSVYCYEEGNGIGSIIENVAVIRVVPHVPDSEELAFDTIDWEQGE